MGNDYGNDLGGFKGSGNDLAGLNEIGTINAPLSRRGSFRGPAMNDNESVRNRGGSESKDRMREPSNASIMGAGATSYGGGYGGVPRPTTSYNDNNSNNNPLGLRRPQTSADPPTGFLSG